MSYSQYTPQEIESRGESIYQTEIRDKVQATRAGEFVVIDIESGDYEVDPDDLSATQRMLDRRPDAVLYGLRIGHSAAYQLGAGMA